jgi:hypothetical protein
METINTVSDIINRYIEIFSIIFIFVAQNFEVRDYKIISI